MNPKTTSNVKAAVIEKLIHYHDFWHKHDRKRCQFNYSYLRYRDAALVSTIERKSVGILRIQNAFELAGINPLCHLSSVLYGNNEAQRKKNYKIILYHLMLAVGGPTHLNDLSVNSNGSMEPPAEFQKNNAYPVCEKYKCRLIPITFKSIYTQGRRLYGNWASALEASGFRYDRIRKKRPKYPRSEVIQDLMRFHEAKQGRFRIQDIRSQNLALYSGIFNSHETSPFKFAKLSVMETAFLELEFHLKQQTNPKLTLEKFCKSKKLNLP
jgi:hypothetical protein